MTFLGFAFLAALPLAAAPIVLHFWDRRRNHVIEWAAMDFLLGAATVDASSRKLKQWLLLLLRTLALLALVLALARPLVSSGWKHVADVGETIFVIDNSMSTTRAVGDQSEVLFDRFKHSVRTSIDRLPRGTTVRLITAAPYPTFVDEGPMRLGVATGDEFERAIDALRPCQGRSDLLAALSTVMGIASEVGVPQREIVVICDGQAGDWRTEQTQPWQQFREQLQNASVPTTIRMQEVTAPTLEDSRAGENLAVMEIAVDHAVVGLDDEVQFTATVQNFGDQPSGRVDLTWMAGVDEVFHDTIDDLGGGEVAQRQWTHRFNSAGVYPVDLRLDRADGLMADNLNSVLVEVIDRAPVLLVDEQTDAPESLRESFFVSAALGWRGETAMPAATVFAPTIVPPSELASLTLDDYRAVVIADLSAIDGSAASTLEDYVRRGGGLWIALGPRTDIDAFNAELFADGNGLSPVAIETVERLRDGVRIQSIGQTQALVARVADGSRSDLADVVLERRFRFAGDAADAKRSDLLSIDDGSPLVVEKAYGRGRVIVSGVPLRLAWSNWIRTQSFVVMVQDFVEWLCRGTATQFNLQPGQTLQFRSDGNAEAATLVTPQAESIELSTQQIGRTREFRTSRTRLPGRYRLELGGGRDPVVYQVRRDAAESDLKPLSTPQRQQIAALVGVNQIQRDGNVLHSVPTDPLWPLLLLALVAAVAGEAWLSGWMTRGQASGSTETQTQSPDDMGWSFGSKPRPKRRRVSA